MMMMMIIIIMTSVKTRKTTAMMIPTITQLFLFHNKRRDRLLVLHQTIKVRVLKIVAF